MSIRKFHSIIVSMGRMAKSCVMRLTADKIFFILTDQNTAVGPSVWAEIDQEAYFNQYNIDGVSKDQNEIYLEFVPDKLAKILNTLKTGQVRSMKMKLAKRHEVPCLCFDLELAGQGDVTRKCVHDFPVSALPRKVWSDYTAPATPQFDVSICLPEMKKLRHLMERYKTLGQTISIVATKQGRLSLKAESVEGVFSTHYPNMSVPVYRDDTLPWNKGDTGVLPDSASVKVEIRRFALFLSGDTTQPKRSILNIVDQELLHMFFLYDDLLVQFYLPATLKP